MAVNRLKNAFRNDIYSTHLNISFQVSLRRLTARHRRSPRTCCVCVCVFINLLLPVLLPLVSLLRPVTAAVRSNFSKTLIASCCCQGAPPPSDWSRPSECVWQAAFTCVRLTLELSSWFKTQNTLPILFRVF